MQEFLIQLVKAVIIQIGGLFGIFFAFGFVLSKLQEWTQKNYFRSVGWKGILWTAWIGTPLHEYSHAFFAKLFRHKIINMALFKPNYQTGELGYVHHSYNQKSFYQSVGNFFIGSAPMISGSLFLVLLLKFILPNGNQVFAPLTGDYSFLGMLKGVIESISILFSWQNLTSGWFWLFLYISFCIASHMAPSKPDRKGIWYGFILIVIVLIILNILFLLIKIDITNYVLTLSKWLSILIAVFTYAIIISFTHLLISKIIFWPIKKLR